MAEHVYERGEIGGPMIGQTLRHGIPPAPRGEREAATARAQAGVA
jgi:hypothetical protein